MLERMHVTLFQYLEKKKEKEEDSVSATETLKTEHHLHKQDWNIRFRPALKKQKKQTCSRCSPAGFRNMKKWSFSGVKRKQRMEGGATQEANYQIWQKPLEFDKNALGPLNHRCVPNIFRWYIDHRRMRGPNQSDPYIFPENWTQRHRRDQQTSYWFIYWSLIIQLPEMERVVSYQS